MRNSINGAWLLGLIMVFMVFMIAYVAISINYSKAFRMKSEMVTAIEEYQGLNANSLRKIGKLSSKYGYKLTGVCDSSSYSNVKGIDFNSGSANVNSGSGRHGACISRTVHATTKAGTTTYRYYYRLSVFFAFNLPVIGEIFDFEVSGETQAIYYPEDTNSW